MKGLLQKYIADKSFYQRTFRIALPLSLQQLLSSCMGIIDTIMVSWIGMVTAVGTATQIDVLQSLVSYGISSGVSMFSAQFYGAKQEERLKKTFGLGILLCLMNSLFWLVLALFFGHEILRFYLNDPIILEYSMQYLKIAMFSMVPFAINNIYGTLYRCTHQAQFTLCISIFGALSNISLNALFIFGFAMIPAMGVQGAALGTLVTQSLLMFVYLIHSIKTKQCFVGTFKEMFHLEWGFVRPILLKMFPLLINETLFGFGSTLFIKAFGELGTQSMDAYYVANQILNCFLFVVYGYGSAISVLIGTRLGQGRIELAKEEENYYIGLSAVLSFILVILMIGFAGPMVMLFGLTDGVVFVLAKRLVYVFAVKISMRLFNYMIFSTLRAGGDAKIIQFLDSGIMYLVGLPLTFGCVYLLHMESIVWVLLIAQTEQLVRMIFGLQRLMKGYWAKDLTKLVSD